jgi:preprotein translocase subunit SecB
VSDAETGSLEAPAPNLQRAARLVPHVHLTGTRLIELHCQFIPDVVIPPSPYTYKLDAGLAWQRHEDGFSYAVKADVAVGPEGNPDEPFWTCSVAQDMYYRVDGADQFEDAEAMDFGLTSGVMAAWPYLREAIQSSSVRAGLSPVVLDVMRLTPGPAEPVE